VPTANRGRCTRSDRTAASGGHECHGVHQPCHSVVPDLSSLRLERGMRACAAVATFAVAMNATDFPINWRLAAFRMLTSGILHATHTLGTGTG